MQIYRRSEFYCAQHITGPAAVLVSIRFGKTANTGPLVIHLRKEGNDVSPPKFDVSNHVSEIVRGVAQANSELNGTLEVEAIEFVPEDYPRKHQAEFVAYKIALSVLRDEIHLE